MRRERERLTIFFTLDEEGDVGAAGEAFDVHDSCGLFVQAAK